MQRQPHAIRHTQHTAQHGGRHSDKGTGASVPCTLAWQAPEALLLPQPVDGGQLVLHLGGRAVVQAPQERSRGRGGGGGGAAVEDDELLHGHKDAHEAVHRVGLADVVAAVG